MKTMQTQLILNGVAISYAGRGRARQFTRALRRALKRQQNGGGAAVLLDGHSVHLPAFAAGNPADWRRWYNVAHESAPAVD